MTRLLAALALVLALAPPAWSQATPSGAAPPAVESAPQPPPTSVAPPPAGTGGAAPAPPAAPQSAARPTLIPNPGDPADVDEVSLPGKPAAVFAGTTTWDVGFKTLQSAFRRIEEELARASLAPAGRPLTVFLESDDLGFRYEAMIPVAEVPAGRLQLGNDVRFGRTPEGRALRFVHKGAYEEIDDTYETITAYLDAKGTAVKDAFAEEYVSDLVDPADANLEVNIFVQPQ